MRGELSQVGPFVVLSSLGHGSMGDVYLAHDPALDERFAVKVLAAELALDEESMARFLRELESMALLADHPGIVRIQSAGRTQEGRPYIAMQYVQGETLRAAFRTMPREQALDAIEQVAHALGYAHERGLVHRDVKPDNVLVGADGRARLTDFGVAKVLRSEGRQNRGLTQTGEILGTPAYMAPEQVNPAAGEVGPWTDVYGLGALVYEALSGGPPLWANTPIELYADLMEGKLAPPLRQRAPGAPAELEALCSRAMHADPRQRFPDGAAFAAALAEVRKPAPEPDRRPLWIAGGALALCVLAGGVGVWVDLQRRAEVSGEVGGELAAVEALLAAGSVDEAIEAGEALLAAPSPPPGAAELVARARVAAVAAAFESRDLVRARERVDALGPDAECPERPWVLALTGAFDRRDGLPPQHAARVAAWAGDAEACAEELARLSAPRRTAYAWELTAFLPGSTPDAPTGDRGDAGWLAAARAERHLRVGALGLAALGFGEARDGGGDDPELLLFAMLGQLRVHVARGRLKRAVETWSDAWSLADDPLDRARCLGWGATLVAATDDTPELRTALDAPFDGGLLAAAAREAPGVPRVVARGSQAPAASAPWSALLAARAAARKGEDASALLIQAGAHPDVAKASFVLGELELMNRTGPVGRLVTRGWDLSRRALEGNVRELAIEALQVLEPAARLAPHVAAVWLARSNAQRVLHRPDETLAMAREALERAPRDAACLLALAHARAAQVAGVAERADLVRLDRKQADPDLERKVAEGLEAAAKAARDAVAATAGALEVEARLVGARALLERARRLLFAGDASARDLPQEVEGAGELLEPVVRRAKIDAIVKARVQLVRALETGDLDLRPVSEAENALKRAVRGVSPAVEEALFLAATLGTPESGRYAKALLGRVDLRARSLIILHAAEQDETQLSLAPRAVTLSPDLPQAVFEMERTKAVNGALDDATFRSLARAINDAPEWVPFVLGLFDGYAPPPGLAEVLGSERDRLARAIYQAVTLRRTESLAKQRELVEEVCLDVEAALRRGAGTGAYLVRAAAVETLRSPELLRELRLDLASARAGAPWSGPVLLSGLPHAEDPEALVEQLLALGYLRNHQSIVDRAGRRNAERVNALLDLVGKETFHSLNLRHGGRKTGPIGLARAIHGRLHPTLEVTLRLNAAREGNDPLHRDHPLSDLVSALERVSPQLAAASQAYSLWLRDRSEHQPDIARSARRALRYGAPAGLPPRLHPGRWRRAIGARRHVPYPDPHTAELFDRLEPHQLPLDATYRRLGDRGSLTNMLATSEQAILQAGRRVLFSRVDLFDRVSRSQGLLMGAQDPLAQRRAAKQLTQAGQPDEALLAINRAIAFAHGRAGWQEAVYDHVTWSLRWHGLWDGTPARRRKALLRRGVSLAKGAALLSAGERRESFSALAADLELDLAGIAPEGSDLRDEWIRRAPGRHADPQADRHEDRARKTPRLLARGPARRARERQPGVPRRRPPLPRGAKGLRPEGAARDLPSLLRERPAA